MRAAVITRAGGPEVLEIRDVARPLPREGEVLIRVAASALNRADLLQRAGRYPAPAGAPSDIPGLEIAGTVFELGDAVASWKVGDRVFGIVGGGGNAEYCISRERELARVPDRLSWTDAAAIPEAFITAHDALVTLGRMRRGEYVLVHAAGSGVGLAVVQLVRALGGASIGTARTEDKLRRARELGLDHAITIAGDPAMMVDEIARVTDGRGVDVVIDLVGGSYLSADVGVCAPLARIVLVGLLAGRSATLDLGSILNRRISIRGTVLRSRPAVEKAEATAAFARDVLPLIEHGAVRPVIDCVLPLDRIRNAHELLESNRTFGKVVLEH
jgi:putative PIG3 family NAD(P)H quinone oxidoreductase